MKYLTTRTVYQIYESQIEHLIKSTEQGEKTTSGESELNNPADRIRLFNKRQWSFVLTGGFI